MQPSVSTRSKVGRCAAQDLVEDGRVCDGVGDHDGEHGGQRRREHRCPLRHAPDRPAVAPGDGGLGDRVGGADGLGRSLAAVAAQLLRGLRHAGQQQVHRQAHADQPGGADRDPGGAGPERLGDGLRRAVGVGEAVRAGARRWRRRS
jgi:hypothetical protein